MSTARLMAWFALLAGSLDLFTGIGLVFFPALTLQLMRAAPLGREAMVFVQWLGAFVAAVGTSYLWALARGGELRLRTVLEITALARLFVGVFTAWAIIDGRLGLAWISVPVSDLTLAGAQLWLLRRLGREHDALL